MNSQFYSSLKRLDTIEKETYLNELKELHLGKKKKTIYEKIVLNLKAGITVGLVNLPLCISFAVASGLSPELGVLSGIWGGILGGLIGGSYFNVIGPAGALSSFLLTITEKYGAKILPYYSLIAGLVAFVSMRFNLGRYIDLFPDSVNEGFTSGIAFSIFFGQMANALGLPKIPSESHGEETIIAIIIKNLSHLNLARGTCFIVYLLFFICLVALQITFSSIPWIILITILGILFGVWDATSINLNLPTLGQKFGLLNLKLFNFISEIPMLDGHILLFNPKFYFDCIPIAFVLIIECLVAAKIADTSTNTKFHNTRELKGLYISNIVVGILGGFPVTASLPRTALNVKSGATHKYSSVINGVVMLILGALLIGFFSYLPMCIMAAMVCFLAYRMVNWVEIKHWYHNDTRSFNLFLVVFIVSVVEDPIIGIIVGMLIHLMLFTENLLTPFSEVILSSDDSKKNPYKRELINNNDSYLDAHFNDIPPKDIKYIIYRFIGGINFMNIEHHKDRIIALSKNDQSTIVLSLKYIYLIDHEGISALKKLIDLVELTENKYEISDGELLIAEKDEIEVIKRKIILSGITKSKLVFLEDKTWLKKLRDNGQLFSNEVLDLENNFLNIDIHH